MDLQVGEEPNIDFSMAAQAQPIDGTVGNSEPNSESEPTNNDLTIVDETTRGSSDIPTTLINFTMSSSMGIFEAIGSNSLSSILEKLIMLLERIRAMISRHQRGLRLSWLVLRAVVSTLAFIVICWELHGMRTQLEHHPSLQTRSLLGTAVQALRLPDWLGLTLPIAFVCAFVIYRHRKQHRKRFSGSSWRYEVTPDNSLPMPSLGTQQAPYQASGIDYRQSESSNRTSARREPPPPFVRCFRCRHMGHSDDDIDCVHCLEYRHLQGPLAYNRKR